MRFSSTDAADLFLRRVTEVGDAPPGTDVSLADYCRNSFLGRWQDAPHYRLLMPALERVERGECLRLAVFLPPRHSKSEVCSVRFPAWYLGRNPDHRIILVTHTDRLSYRFSRKVRNQIGGRGWPFPTVGLARGEFAIGNWGLAGHSGGLMAAGAGGAIAGEGANLIVMDDPHRNRADADSPVMQEKIWDWYQDDVYSRLEPDGAILLMMQRWNTGDVGGRILEHQPEDGIPWEVIELPALIEDEEDAARDTLHRELGEALWPERWPAEALRAKRADMSPRAWASQYQQTPGDEASRFLKKDWTNRRYPDVDVLQIRRMVQTCDSAWTEGVGSDWSVIATWAEVEVNRGLPEAEIAYALLDIWRDKVELVDLLRALQDVHSEWAYWWGRSFPLVAEKKASGIAAVQILKHTGAVPIIPFPAEGDKGQGAFAQLPKMARFESVIHLFQAGKVILPERAPWLATWLKEHRAAPATTLDDQIDTTSMALHILAATHKARFRKA